MCLIICPYLNFQHCFIYTQQLLFLKDLAIVESTIYLNFGTQTGF